MIFAPRYAMMASAVPIIAEVPVASPSRPSVRLAPLDVAVTTNITTSTNSTHPPVAAYLPIHCVK